MRTQVRVFRAERVLIEGMTAVKQTAKIGQGKPGPGRPRGRANNVTKEVREMVVAALEQLGGVDYLVKCGNDPRTRKAFLSLVGKALPIKADVSGGIGLTIINEFNGDP